MYDLLSSIEGRARDVPEDAAFAIGKCNAPWSPSSILLSVLNVKELSRDISSPDIVRSVGRILTQNHRYPMFP
jgi:hypothetical protein